MTAKKYNINFFYWISLILVFALVGYAVHSIKNSKTEYIVEKERYYKDSYSGILRLKWLNRGYNILLKKNSSRSKHYLYSSKNYNYDPSDLYYFIQKGDSIVKLPNSYDLYIYRGNRQYYFKLGEEINK